MVIVNMGKGLRITILVEQKEIAAKRVGDEWYLLKQLLPLPEPVEGCSNFHKLMFLARFDKLNERHICGY